MKALRISSLLLLGMALLLCPPARAQEVEITAEPENIYFSDQEPYDKNKPIKTYAANGCADEGRFVNINSRNIIGPIKLSIDNCSIMGPACPTYDDEGNRIPEDEVPPNCEDCEVDVFITEQPKGGTTIEASFSTKDDGYWTVCSENQQNQFPQVVTVKYNLIGIQCDMGKELACTDGKVHLSASLYPGEGTVKFITDFGVFNGNHLEVELPAGYGGGKVTCVYSVGGATTTCEATIKPGKLKTFALPYCVDVTEAAVAVKDVAIVTFEGACQPKVAYTPAQISTIPTLAWTTVGVAATGGGVTLNASTIAVNSKKEATISPAGFDLFNIIYKYKDVIDAIQKGFAKTSGVGSPCKSPTSPFSVTVAGPSISTYQLCCNGQYMKAGRKVKGSVAAAFSIKCAFPIPIPGLTYPGVFTIDAVVSASGGIEVAVDNQTTCTNDKICWTATGKGSFGGGIGITVLSGVVSGDLQLVCDGLALNAGCCWQEGQPTTCTASATVGAVKVVGTITVGWFYTMSADYPLLDGWTTQLI